MKFEEAQPIEILKGTSEKLVVKLSWFQGHLDINVGRQRLRRNGEYTYTEGFNVRPCEARELSAALLETARCADEVAQCDDFCEGGEDE